ncbi:Uncharacterized protein Adt_30362 [Abeliophyllum distichum]|uniref:Uncharacterized protein n=1 Tax=Abeliophyllum distichum TaxID=126358 RepID=A0ABD1RCJ9_9LAMI
MASSRQFQECFDKIRRGSKAQMCLHKILRIISTVPPHIATVKIPPSSVSETEKKGSKVDSDVEFFELKEMVEESRVYTAGGLGLSSSSTTVGTGGPPDLHGGGDSRINIGSCSSGGDECDQLVNDAKYHSEAERSLNLLIEATKLIFGEFEENNKSESKSASKSAEPNELKKNKTTMNESNEAKLKRRSRCWQAAEISGYLEDTASPVVRSKRGRTLFLPRKYRDSVLEPLSQLSSHRSSIIPRKRRSNERKKEKLECK